MHSRIRRSMADKDQGFTLIELLVVIIIIGILAAIAIPVFLNQRKKGVDASLKSDLKNAAVIMETWAVDKPGVGFGADQADSSTTGTAALNGLKVSPGNTIWLRNSINTQGGYCIYAANPNASKAFGSPFMVWRSLLGGLDPAMTGALAPDCA